MYVMCVRYEVFSKKIDIVFVIDNVVNDVIIKQITLRQAVDVTTLFAGGSAAAAEGLSGPTASLNITHALRPVRSINSTTRERSF